MRNWLVGLVLAFVHVSAAQVLGYMEGLAMHTRNYKAGEQWQITQHFVSTKTYQIHAMPQNPYAVKLEILDTNDRVLASKEGVGNISLRFTPPKTQRYFVRARSLETKREFAMTIVFYIENGGWVPSFDEIEMLRLLLTQSSRILEESLQLYPIYIDDFCLCVFVASPRENVQFSANHGAGEYALLAYTTAATMDLDMKVYQNQRLVASDTEADSTPACSVRSTASGFTVHLITNGYAQRSFVVLQTMRIKPSL